MCMYLAPLPMKLRALPASFWEQPNLNKGPSPGTIFSALPPLCKEECVEAVISPATVASALPLHARGMLLAAAGCGVPGATRPAPSVEPSRHSRGKSPVTRLLQPRTVPTEAAKVVAKAAGRGRLSWCRIPPPTPTSSSACSGP